MTKYAWIGLAIASSLTAQAVVESIDFKHRSHREWQFALPSEQFVKVGSAIELAGHTFVAERDGTGLAIDTDGDGKTNVTVQGKAGFVKLEKDGFRYAVRLANRGGGWHYASSCVRQGKVDGQKVRLFDQDGNGRFDDYGIDAMIVGRGKTATFLSKAISIGGKVMSFDVDRDGVKVALQPYSGSVGTLDLSSALTTKGKLLSAIVRSQDGDLSFDLARGVTKVPTGTYRIHSGSIGLGETTVSVRRGGAKDLVVTEDSTCKLDWGGPARAEFAYQRDGGKVEFRPDQVWYFGDSGEEYVNWNPVGKSPTFQVKVGGETVATAIFPGSC